VICVNFDSMAMKPRPGRSEPPAKDVLLQHAVEWVRYSNQICGYCVRHWELGNESYHANSLGTMQAEDYARCFVEFARAMKEVDPDILVGANGHVSKDARSKADEPDGPIWWKTLLEIAGDEIDYLAVHPYPCWKWGSYDYFIEHQPRFTDAVDEALAAVAEWAPQHSGRIRVLVTETNSADWTASNFFPELTGWPLENDLGHALVLFDIIGQHLLHPQVDGLQVWNTRWVNPAAKELWNTLDENNGYNATGYALAIWGQNLLREMVAVESSPAVCAYASYNPASHNLNIFLLNKTRERQPVDLLLPGFVENWAGDWLALTGKHSEDQAPVYQKITDLSGSGPQVDLGLPPLSISIIRLRPAGS
jgi:alpha-L-arabinofuranosidase